MGTTTPTLEIDVLEGDLSIVQLAADDAVPAWVDGPGFTTVSRARDELSIVVPSERVPDEVADDGGWRLFRLVGPFAFDEIGVLASVTAPLAAAGVGIFVVSTFNTDYLLVKAPDADRCVDALRRAGHTVRTPAGG